MNTFSTHDVTAMLARVSEGDRAAMDELLPLVYGELRRVAARYLRRERSCHTLQPTALVNEAYLKLVEQRRTSWRNRAQFIGVAARIMRRILVDSARERAADKRGRGVEKISLGGDVDKAAERGRELVALDDALRALAQVDERKARIVELRYFGGLSVEETANLMGVTPVTIHRHWRAAKSWLYGYLTGAPL